MAEPRLSGGEELPREPPPKPEPLSDMLSVVIQKLEGAANRKEVLTAGKTVADRCVSQFDGLAPGEKVVIQFTISSSGRVPVAAVSQGLQKRRGLANCLARVMREQQLTAPEPDARAVVFLGFSG